MPASTPRDNSGCLIPFGALFALVGIGVGISTLIQTSPRARDTGTRLMLAAIFVITGASGVAWGVAGRRTAQRTNALAREHPGQPWLWRADWARGTADSESASSFLTYGLMGILFVGIAAPALANFRRELMERHNYPILLALIFPLAGLFLISKALLDRVRARKFAAVFRMAQVPGVAGGHLRGRIETRFALPPDQAADLTLNCVRSYTSGNNRDRWEEVVWEDKAAASPALGPAGSLIPVDFEIPIDVRDTDATDPSNLIFWRLTASRKLPGVDFKVSFQVPVFKTSASDSSITAGKLEEDAVAHAAPGQPAGAKIRVTPAAEGGVQFYLGPARSKGVAAALMAFGLIFSAGGFFFGFAMRGSFGWVIGGIPVLLGAGIGLLLLLFSLSLWLSTTTLRIAGGELHIKSSFLGIARNKTLRAAEIQNFELYPGMRSGNQVWYDLRVHLKTGGKVTAGSGLEKREAEWLESEIRKNLGYRSL